MANIKPAELRTGKTGKEEIAKRKQAEAAIRGSSPISRTPGGELSDGGKRIYREVIKLLPDGFLSGADKYAVEAVADALARMQECRSVLNDGGMFDEGGAELDAVKTYERYSKIFDKQSSKLGLSPKDRAALAVLNINAEEEKNDPLLQVLRGE